MTINDEILTIANQIANQGNKPSVARIKTKLSHPVPLPKIIAVLKTWQHDPDFTSVKLTNTEQSSTEVKQDQQLVALIEQAIQPLRNEINELKELVKALKKQA